MRPASLVFLGAIGWGVVYSRLTLFIYHNSRFELTAAVFWKEIG